MAVLLRRRDDSYVSLAAQTLVGRFPACEWVLANPRVSGNHAQLLHDGERWWVKPHVTRNGSFLNDELLTPGSRHAVTSTGARLRLGSSDEEWEWIDVGPPGAAAIGCDGTLRTALDGVLALPAEERPVGTVVWFAGACSTWAMCAAACATARR